jgi:hypothetical protein
MSENRKILNKSGNWAMSSDPTKADEIVFREEVHYADKVEIVEKTPESQGLVKEIKDFPILFVREIPSQEELDGKITLIFKQLITVKVKEDPENRYKYLLIGDSGKIYLKNLNMGSTTQLDLCGSEDVSVIKSKPKRITKEEATELVLSKKTGYFFGKVESDENGNVTGYGKVVKSA